MVSCVTYINNVVIKLSVSHGSFVMTGDLLIQCTMEPTFTRFKGSVLVPSTVFVLLLCNRFNFCPEAAHCSDSTGIIDCSDRGVLSSEGKQTHSINFSCFLCCHSEICCERNDTLTMKLSTNRVKFLGFCSFLLSLNNYEENSSSSNNEGSAYSLSPGFIGFNGFNNGITEIPCFVQWSVMRWVDLSNNKISMIVRRLYFGKDSSLKTLILKNNFIHVILPYVFSRLTHLEHVFLNGNPCVDDWSFLQHSSSLIMLDYRRINMSSSLDSSLCGSCRNGTTVILNEMALIEYNSTCAQDKTFCSFVSEWPDRILALTSGLPLRVCTEKDGDLSTVITTDNTTTSLPGTTEPSFTGATKKWVQLLFVLVVILVLLLTLERCCMKNKSRFKRYSQFYSTRISIADPQRNELYTETYYSTIPENTTQGKIFSGNEVNLIVCLKNGSLYHRWMGTVTSNDGHRCVISLIVAENALRSQSVHWDEFVRNSLDLPRNQHLVNLEGIYFRNENVYLVQEYLSCETLYARLQHCRDYSPSSTSLTMATSEVIRHLLGILEGLQLLNSFDFLHPGLSTKKVLLANKGICKLYDFCLDKDAGSITNIKKSQLACDMNQFAPEALYENKYTKASDVWSLAVVFWEILSGHAPFESDEKAITDKESSKAWPEQYKAVRNDHLFDCWQPDCTLRPSVETLRSSFVEISHSLVNEIPGAASRDVTESHMPMARTKDAAGMFDETENMEKTKGDLHF